jgi:hypothetical protein
MTVCTRFLRMAQSPFQIQCKNLQTVMKSLSIVFNSLRHRVDRVLSFFSNRPNWDPPTHSSPGECVPAPLWFREGEGTHSLAGEGGGGPNSDEGADTGTLSTRIYVLCSLRGNICKQSPFDVLQEVWNEQYNVCTLWPYRRRWVRGPWTGAPCWGPEGRNAGNC